MINKTRSILLHTVEGTTVLLFAAIVAYLFPEHAMPAGMIAFMTLTTMAKYARVSENIPIPDYVNKNPNS